MFQTNTTRKRIGSPLWEFGTFFYQIYYVVLEFPNAAAPLMQLWKFDVNRMPLLYNRVKWFLKKKKAGTFKAVCSAKK